MDYEKAYKELVKNFNTVLNLNSTKQNGAVPVEDIVKMIPELKETEDNSIKEELINFLNTYICAHGCTEMSKWVSWIEKQGKKNNLLNFDEAEKEKNDFVSGQFIECRKSFNEFKELESYWLEYVGDDTYIGRSDNILNQKFHITPRQLFTLFTHEHCPKENNDEQKEINTNWEDKIKGLNKLEEYILSLDPNRSLDAVKVDAKNIRFLVNEEQNPVDKVEPKFKVGDWVVYNRNGYSIEIMQIYDIRDNRYYFNDNAHFSWSVKECDEKCHLWTIQDAKDGDMLSYVTDEGDLWIMIYKSLYEPYEGHVHYHALLINGNFDYKGTCCIFIDNLKPSTKEQCDILFQRIHEEGYEWDAEKKELKKIEQKNSCSEKDESWFKELELMALSFSNDDSYRKKFFEWLKSLKDRVQPQPKQEWSEEDKSMLTSCIGILGKCYMKELPNKVEKELNWLISLKDRVQPQPKQPVNTVWYDNMDDLIADAMIDEINKSNMLDRAKYNRIYWINTHRDKNIECSEEDEKKIMWLVRLISTEGFRELDSDKMPCSRTELIDWLKSLQSRINIQQKQEWTEEDERMLNLFLHKLEVCNLLSNNENTWIINKLKSINKTNDYPQKNEYNNNCKEDIEPKFMVGDTIRLKNSEAEYTITNIHDRCYHGKGWSLDIEKTDASDDWELVNPKQSCWKPTEEQMNAFRKLLDYNIGVFEYKSYMIVESLYEDLQKNTEK